MCGGYRCHQVRPHHLEQVQPVVPNLGCRQREELRPSPPSLELTMTAHAAGPVSAVDLLAFARMVARRGAPVLPEELAEAMATHQLTTEQKENKGSGTSSSGSVLELLPVGAVQRPFGWDGGFRVAVAGAPAQHLVVIVLTERMFETCQTPRVHWDTQAAEPRVRGMRGDATTITLGP
ncbi:MAG TPA: serine hydrolase [Acidimicrobiales bacterium]|nr:serine hydrolase [Acidimicrobiales bacterium]